MLFRSQDNFLHQHVNSPTRDNRILDLVFSDCSSLIKKLEIGENLGCSDHNIIRFTVNLSYTISVNSTKIPDFNSGDFDKFRILLDAINWEYLFEDRNCYEMWDIFKNTLGNLQSMCFKSKKLRQAAPKPLWFNREVRQMRNEKVKAYKRFKESENAIDLGNYRIVRNELKRLIRESKRLAEINLARNSKDLKKFFGYYKMKSRNRKVGPIRRGDHMIDREEEMVNIFNDFFVSVFTEEDLESFSETIIEEDLNRRPVLENLLLEREEIENILGGLDISKSVGPDGIYGRILREGCKRLSIAMHIV